MTTEEILALAKSRAQEKKLSYEGALLPVEAGDLMRHAGAILIDVRTRAEWEYVGRIPGAVEIEWNSWPGGARNPEFLKQLQEKVAPDAIAMFICRSGVRSHHAAHAATQAGYRRSFNVLEGFEGNKDGAGHRNTIGGWRVAGLPWTQ